jgi:hypothetical protein
MVEAGLPPGVVNLVTGGGAEVGDAIVDLPDVPVISFTGSSVTGRRPSSSNARSGLSSGRADASASKMADQMHDLDQIGLSAARRAARDPPGGGRPVAFVHQTHATAVFVH